jgi:hypothetical protein
MATAASILDNLTDIPPALQSSNYNPDELQNERFLEEHIMDLWETRTCYGNAIRGERTGLRGVEHSLGQMLFNLKVVLCRPGRNGKWSAWLHEHHICRATGDRLVARFARSIAPKISCVTESTKPTQLEIEKLFHAVWPKLAKTLTTEDSFYDFICYLAGRSGIAHQYRDNGVLILDPEYTKAQPEVVTSPLSSRTAEAENAEYGDVL